MEFTVLLTSVTDVKGFVDTVTEAYPYEVDVLAGRYVVNGKSIMGLFSIDLSKPVTVRMEKDGPEAEQTRERLAGYLV